MAMKNESQVEAHGSECQLEAYNMAVNVSWRHIIWQ